MLFGKKDHLIGIDIGSRTIKVAEVNPDKNGYSLKNFGLMDLPPGVIEDGSIKNPEAAASAINELLSTNKIKEQNVAISIGGYSVIVKKVNIQKMPEEQLQESIHLEAEQYIPFDIADVNLDFQILGDSEAQQNQMSVLLVAAKKEMIEEYINVLHLAKLNPCIIDVDAFALQNVYESNYSTENENVALIDIGDSKTSLNILKGSSSVFMRDVSLGCGQITRKISAHLGCSVEEAIQVKSNPGGGKLSAADLKDMESGVVSDWCTEIRRALDFFYSTYTDDQIKRIILSGGGANIKEFRRLLSSETSTDVIIINPFENFRTEEEGWDSATLEQAAPQAAICMGLAIRRVNDK